MKNIALFENSDKPEAIKWAEFTAKKLMEFGAEVCARPELIELFDDDLATMVRICPVKEFDNFADIVITFGGDGTMLAAARKLITKNIPIMGVNVGKLGFLAEFKTDSLEKSLKDILDGNYRIVDRSVLETTIDDNTIYALNDFVVEKRDSSHMIIVKAYANGHFIGDYRADGLILTTPTGSSAYSLSCGGPIIAPTTKALCLTPISPHTLTIRPLVIPDSNEIELVLSSGMSEANLVADGFVEHILSDSDKVIFKISEHIVKLIKPKDSSFFDLLREKMLWAVDGVGRLENPKKDE